MRTHQGFPIATLLTISLCLAGSGLIAAEPLEDPLQPVYFESIRIGGFWQDQFKRLSLKWIPHCIRQIEPGGAGQELLNLINVAKARRGEPHGDFTGLPWSDAYVYNTIEAVSLALTIDPEGDPQLTATQARLRKSLDEWIPIVLAAQQKDGYAHSFEALTDYKRYTDIKRHDMYVQGYLLEAGVAHYRMTGGRDRRLYDAARRCADSMYDSIGPAPKLSWVHGHEGIAYALSRLSRLVNDVEGAGKGDKYAELAKFMLDLRGQKRSDAYYQAHLPVIEQSHAVGHAVRATYLYTGMADLAMLTRDAAYLTAVDRIWDSAVHRKMYITGGVGAIHKGETFGEDFELPNDGYCESCASCGLSFWCDRMNRIHRDAHYADVAERALFNNILGAIELTGENFFYQNPLAGEKARYPWHGCPCCVGNIPRALLAIKDLMYLLNPRKDTLYVNHFVASDGTIADVAGASLRIEQKTEYPWKGDVALTLSPQEAKQFTVKIRIPGRGESELYTPMPSAANKFTVKLNGEAQDLKPEKGYVTLARTWQAGDRIDLSLPMDVQRVYADRRVTADRGLVALQRGPLVYNLENADHGVDVRSLFLKPGIALRAVWKPGLLGGVVAIQGTAARKTNGGFTEAELLAIPNYTRLNRGGWSQVWIAEDPQKTSVAESMPGTDR